MSTQTLQAETGTSTSKNNEKLLIEYFYDWEKNTPNNVFLRQPNEGKWIPYTWKQVGEEARRMATALKSMGFPAKSNIGIVSKNTAHWIISDLAIMLAGHISVPFYPTLQAPQLNEVLVHSGCKALFVGKLDDWNSMKDGIPSDVKVIKFPHVSGGVPVSGNGFLEWNDVINAHTTLQENFVPELDDIATIIYTSGTTGTPKGVVHTFRTQIAPLHAAASIFKLAPNSDGVFFSYLPLCHIAERAIVEGASLYSGGTVSFAETLDTFAANLADTQPTHFLAVPRIWTKFQLGILQKMSQSKLDTFLKIPILSGIVKKKIKKSLGLSRCRLILTGAAPMPASLIEWFGKLGINIQEAYGMTENGGCCTLMRADNKKSGTVGQAYPGIEMKIEPETGEVLMRGGCVMTGYYKEEEKTAEVLKDGWLHTGDMGEIDNQGFLKITGRVKDAFKSAKGEYIVPAPIEFGFAKNNFVEQICVAGRGLPQPIALVVLSELGLKAAKSEVNASLQATLQEMNPKLVNYERVEKVIVVKEAWGVENNVLTPTLKVKRNVIEAKYGAAMEGWYNQPDMVIWEA